MFMCIRALAYVPAHARVFVYGCMCACVCVFECLSVCMCVCACVSVCRHEWVDGK